MWFRVIIIINYYVLASSLAPNCLTDFAARMQERLTLIIFRKYYHAILKDKNVKEITSSILLGGRGLPLDFFEDNSSSKQGTSICFACEIASCLSKTMKIPERK